MTNINFHNADQAQDLVILDMISMYYFWFEELIELWKNWFIDVHQIYKMIVN